MFDSGTIESPVTSSCKLESLSSLINIHTLTVTRSFPKKSKETTRIIGELTNNSESLRESRSASLDLKINMKLK